MAIQNLTLTLSIKNGNTDLPGFPIVARINPATVLPLEGAAVLANNNTSTFNTLPVLNALQSDLQALVIQADSAINLKFNNASYLPVDAGAVVVVFATDVTGTVATLVTVNNPAATGQANLYGLIAGT